MSTITDDKVKELEMIVTKLRNKWIPRTTTLNDDIADAIEHSIASRERVEELEKCIIELHERLGGNSNCCCDLMYSLGESGICTPCLIKQALTKEECLKDGCHTLVDVANAFYCEKHLIKEGEDE